MAKETNLDLNRLCVVAQNGDNLAEKQLFERLSALFRVAAGYRIDDKHDVEEISQTALHTVLVRYRKVSFETSFTAWAYKILDHKVLNYLENKTKEGKRSDRIEYRGESWIGYGREPDVELRRRLMDCLRKVGQINNKFSRAIVLRFQGYNAEEISRRLEITQGNLYVLLSRCRAMLKRCLNTGEVNTNG